ncbi:hypothetical protein ACFQV4_14880 [Streptomyces thermocarboxydus]
MLLAVLVSWFVWHRRQAREGLAGGLLLRLTVSDDSGERTTSETTVPRRRDPGTGSTCRTRTAPTRG